MPPDKATDEQVKLWWMIWAGFLGSLLVVCLFLDRSPVRAAESSNLLFNLVGFVPLFVSIILRWLVLPRSASLARGFPLFVAGLALAEAGGVLGVFLGGPLHNALALLGVLAVLQYVPVFARRLAEPKTPGFFPNN